MEENTYKDGKVDGLRTEWYENGQKKSEGNYKDGWNRDGLWTWWDENGQKIMERMNKDGKEISIKEWNKDGSVRK